MSLRIDTTDWISGDLVIGNTGLGVLGSNIPSSGANGSSILYNDLSLPADANKEIRALILSEPSAGTLFVHEDGSFSFINAPNGTYYFTYQLYVDGVSTGSPATVTLNVGSTLLATGQSISTCTATLTTGIPLLGSAFVVSTSFANLDTISQFASNAISSSSISCVLTTEILLQASAISNSESTAYLYEDGGSFVTLSGVTSTSSIGTISISGDANTSLMGVSTLGSAGTISGTVGEVVDASISLIGVVSGITAGNMLARIRGSQGLLGRILPRFFS